MSPAPTRSTTANAISTTTSSAAEALSTHAARRALVAILQRVVEIQTKRANRRRDAEENAGDERDDGGETEDAQVETDVRDPWDVRRIPPREKADAGKRQCQADQRRQAGQYETLGQQLTHDPRRCRRQALPGQRSRAAALRRAREGGWRRWRRR